MNRTAPYRVLLIACAVASATGCMIPAGYRMPQLMPRSIAYERAESTVHDPFPITDAGPDISARPPAFNTPRPEPLRTKDKASVSMLRNRLGTPIPPSYPGARMPSYPGVVR